MITIKQDNTTVSIGIDHGLHSTGELKQIFVSFECGSRMYAELLTNQLNNKLHKLIVLVREEEYNKGWKDAKAKRVKSKWFAGALRKFYQS